MLLPTENTPCYVFDEGIFRERLRKVKEEVGGFDGKLCYAIKANPFLIPFAVDLVDKFEVCSPGELEICRFYGVPGEKILFSGVVKAKEDIKKALCYPADVITLESMQHWTLLKECVLEHIPENTGKDENSGEKATVKIMPRLTNGAQFGMEKEEIIRILEEIKQTDFLRRHISFCGIHYFTGTQKKGNKYEKEIDRAGEFLINLTSAFGTGEEILEYGPGFAVPYFTGDDFEDPFRLVRSMKEYIKERKYPFRIDIELGRYLAASCGRYYTKIMDIKKAEGRNYCLVDGGIHHVNYYGSNMAMRTPVVTHMHAALPGEMDDTGDKERKDFFVMTEEEEGEYMICGALCTFSDLLIRGICLTNPAIGDLLVFENIGAYSITESSYLFLSRSLPAIYCKKEDGSYGILREKKEAHLLNRMEDPGQSTIG